MVVTERAELDFANLAFVYLKTDANLRYTWKDGRWDDGVMSSSETLPLHIAAKAGGNYAASMRATEKARDGSFEARIFNETK